MSNRDESTSLGLVTNCLLLCRLQSIQRKLDKSIFDREAANSEFKVSGRIVNDLSNSIIQPFPLPPFRTLT